MYLQARREGWQPLKQHNAQPWEKRLVKRTFRNIMSHGIGLNRDIAETTQSMRKIIPLAAEELISSLQENIAEKELKSFVQLLGYVADEDLVGLYNGAIGYVTVSLYEGFGLTALEAMSCGKSGISCWPIPARCGISCIGAPSRPGKRRFSPWIWSATGLA